MGQACDKCIDDQTTQNNSEQQITNVNMKVFNSSDLFNKSTNDADINNIMISGEYRGTGTNRTEELFKDSVKEPSPEESFISRTGIINQLANEDIDKKPIKMKDGALYFGETHKGKPTGYGKMMYPDGDEYLGYFVEGMMQGRGKYHKFKQFNYLGEFKKDEITGNGTIAWADGENYTGQFYKGDYHGFGTLIM